MKDEFSPYVREAVVLEDHGFLTVREFAAIVAEAMWPSASDAGKRQVTQKAWGKRLSEEIRNGAVTAHNQITKMPIDPPAEGMAWGFDIGPERLLDTLLSTTEARKIAEQSGINVTFSDQRDLAEELQAARDRIAELEAALAVAKAADVPKKADPFANSTYSTSWLFIQWAATAKFFEQRGAVDAKKDEVVDWIISEAKKAGLPYSKNIAEAIFTIIKPHDHDPRKRRG